MIDISYRNQKGEELCITKGDIRAVSVTGLSPEATINLSEISGYDGGTHVSTQVPVRNVLILLGLRGNLEKCKKLVYDTFRLKQPGTLFYTGSDGRKLQIDCEVEKTPYTLEANASTLQVSLICASPYFRDCDNAPAVMATLTPNWEYPLTIDDSVGIELTLIDPSLIAKVTNSGQMPVGCVFEIRALGNLHHPKIQDINSFEFIGAEVDLSAGDVLFIDTRQGQKSLRFLRGTTETNVFNSLMDGSTFLQLAVGDNEFRRFAADGNEDNMEVICRFENLCGGI